MANELVAEDSKDFYFAMEKRRFLGFEIVKIEYTDNFTKATVLATVEVNYRPSARFPTMRVKPPYKTLWKVEDGQWYWYTVQTGEWETPFGTMKVPAQTNEQADPAAAVVAQIRGADPKAILSQVKASKNDIALRCCENSSDTAEIVNGTPGVISLRVEGSPAIGLDIKLDRNELKPGEKAQITFVYAPPTKQAKPAAIAVLRVAPLGTAIQFKVTFD